MKKIKKVTGILINPEKQTVEQVELSEDAKLQPIYEMLNVDLIDTVGMINGDYVIVDDEGLLKNNRYFFALPLLPPLAGNALIIRDNPSTEKYVNCKSTVEEIKAVIRYYADVDGSVTKYLLDQTKIISYD